MLCVGFSLCYVWVLVCVMSSFAATNLVAPLKACLASFFGEGPNQGAREVSNKGPRDGSNNQLCHVEGGKYGENPPIDPP